MMGLWDLKKDFPNWPMVDIFYHEFLSLCPTPKTQFLYDRQSTTCIIRSNLVRGRQVPTSRRENSRKEDLFWIPTPTTSHHCYPGKINLSFQSSFTASVKWECRCLSALQLYARKKSTHTNHCCATSRCHCCSPVARIVPQDPWETDSRIPQWYQNQSIRKTLI